MKPMILIADDNHSMRKMIRSLVQDLDSEILECADGSEAIRLYEQHRPGWVLMDVSMHPVDGITATREITGRFPGSRVVIITQHDDAETRRGAFEAGAFEFFGKDDLLPIRALIRGN
jgi:CheY-like chemotaxis protein